jgi:putative tryptophan/tyrosine transport system substrate-binding protein
MRRREFISLIGSATAAWPLAARAQRPSKLPTIGFLGSGTPSTYGERLAVFVQRLHELGWTDGRTIAIEVRWAEGRGERYAQIAAEFVQLKVDAIITMGTPPTLAAKQSTSTIPIVFAQAGDPVGSGIVSSFAHPGGNLTGLSIQQADAAGKRLDLLQATIPGLRSLAILGNVSNPSVVFDMHEAEGAAQTVGFKVIPLEIRRAEDIAPAIDTSKGRADALYVCADSVTNTHRIGLNILAVGARLPTMYSFREFVDAGGLMSYGPDTLGQLRRAAEIVDKILRGTKPADIPVEQPTKFDLTINLTTAKALGLTIPESILVRADELIE